MPVTRGAGSLLLALGGIAFGLLIAEMGLGAWRPVRPGPFVPDDALLYRLRPGMRETLRDPRSGREVPFETDALGCRRGGSAPPGAPRVVVYGDSFVEARFTPFERTFGARLQEALSAGRGRAAFVVNAGVTGYGPDQCARRMERELPGLAPRLAVLVVYAGNDGGDVVRNKLIRLDASGRPFLAQPRLDSALLRVLGAPVGKDRFALVRALRYAGNRLGWDARGAEPRGLDWALRECRREHADRVDDPDVVHNLFLDHYDADLALEPGSEPARSKRRLLQAALERARDASARARVPLLVVVVPDARDVCRDCPETRVDAARFAGYRPSGLTDAVADIAAAEGIACLDLFDAFRRSPEVFYQPHDGHWSDEGQAAAAKSVAARILEAGWLP